MDWIQIAQTVLPYVVGGCGLLLMGISSTIIWTAQQTNINHKTALNNQAIIHAHELKAAQDDYSLRLTIATAKEQQCIDIRNAEYNAIMQKLELYRNNAPPVIYEALAYRNLIKYLDEHEQTIVPSVAITRDDVAMEVHRLFPP